MDTVKSSREIDAAFKEGTKVSTPYFMLIKSKTPSERDQSGRVAFIAGKKLGSAPIRSRCKRVLRETVARSSTTWEGFDIIMVAKQSAAAAQAAKLDEAFYGAIFKLGIGR